jgi:hypothetical protein
MGYVVPSPYARPWRWAERLFGRAFAVGVMHAAGYRYVCPAVTGIDPQTGRETLLSKMQRRQDQRRDPNDLVRR